MPRPARLNGRFRWMRQPRCRARGNDSDVLVTMLHKRRHLPSCRALVTRALEPGLSQPHVVSEGLTAGARRGPPRPPDGPARQDPAAGHRRRSRCRPPGGCRGSALIAATSSSGATGECMRGKYRFAGARNRPAAVTTGRPAVAERANARVAWLRPPTSRITVTPLAAYSFRRATPYWLSARNGPCSSLATVGCACASTSPASAYRPGSSTCSPVPETTRSLVKPSRNSPENVHATQERYRSCGADPPTPHPSIWTLRDSGRIVVPGRHWRSGGAPPGSGPPG